MEIVDETPFRTMHVDHLRVEVYPSRRAMGLAAARRVAQHLRTTLATKPRASVVLASAPSQSEFLSALIDEPGVDWQRVIAFHMDEYTGLAVDAPQGFGRFLRDHLFSKVTPGVVHYLDGNAADLRGETDRYSALLRAYPPDIVCGGIGENGHLAFNDPPVADFNDPLMVKAVDLVMESREQQVHDECFERLQDVPMRALTLTIPALVSAAHFSCVVPSRTKAEAVRDMLFGPISTACPASVLRRHPGAVLYLDPESASIVGAVDPREPSR